MYVYVCMCVCVCVAYLSKLCFVLNISPILWLKSLLMRSLVFPNEGILCFTQYGSTAVDKVSVSVGSIEEYSEELFVPSAMKS